MTDQPDFSNPSLLPIESADKSRSILQDMGVVFGLPATDHDGYGYVSLPIGWRITATSDDHGLYALLDEKDRRRAIIINAENGSFFTSVNRYGVDRYIGVVEQTTVTDCGKPIYTVPGTGADAQSAAYAWINENFPDWTNPFAYWD